MKGAALEFEVVSDKQDASLVECRSNTEYVTDVRRRPFNLGGLKGPLVEATATSSQPVVRRRLGRKTPAASVWEVVSRSSGIPASESVHGGRGILARAIPADPASWWAEKSHSEKYDYVYNRLRRNRVYQRFQEVEERRQGKKMVWPSSWTALSMFLKRRFLAYWADRDAGDLPRFVATWAVECMLCSPRPGASKTQDRNSPPMCVRLGLDMQYINRLLQKKRRLMERKTRVQHDLRNAQRKRRRLLRKAKLLSRKDLVGLLALRQDKDEGEAVGEARERNGRRSSRMPTKRVR